MINNLFNFGGISHDSLSAFLLANQANNITANNRFHGLNPCMPKIDLGISGCSITAINNINPQRDLYQSLKE